MNILIITSVFPPDTAIGGVRPFMFARNLTAMGENVTVIRSGDLEKAPFDGQNEEISFEVLTALGKNSPVEKFLRGEYEGYTVPKKRMRESLPRPVRVSLKAVRDSAVIIRGKPPKCISYFGSVLKCKKRLIDKLHSEGRSFDVVFSTCGGIENIYAGKYAAEKFGAKLIMDFRDSMIFKGQKYVDFWWNKFGREATLCALKNADCCTSVGSWLASELRKIYPPARVEVIYNGFDDLAPYPEVTVQPDRLTFCYTGRFLKDEKPSLSVLVKVLAELIKEKKIDRDKIRFCYAGSDPDDFSAFFKAEGISDIFESKGYISKDEAFKLQAESDVYTVLSWNTVFSRGMLTGKFYEGIKARKPILTVLTGAIPDSELMEIHKQYDYGFCYEHCRRKTERPALKSYIEGLYNEKLSNGVLSFTPSKELYDAFSYSSLSEKLYRLIHELADK